MLYFLNPDDLLIPNMIIDTSSQSSCSRRSPWSPSLFLSYNQFYRAGCITVSGFFLNELLTLYLCKNAIGICQFDSLTVHFQPMWLAKLEPEPILQLEHHLPGHVAAQRQGDLRRLDDYLHQWDHRALEAEVSKSHGWKGAYNIAFWGIFIQSKTAIIQPKNGIFGQILAFGPMPDQKSMQTRCPGDFSVMLVPKLLLTAIEIRVFGQKNGQIWPKICIVGHFGPNIGIYGPLCPMLDQKNANMVSRCFLLSG